MSYFPFIYNELHGRETCSSQFCSHLCIYKQDAMSKEMTVAAADGIAYLR